MLPSATSLLLALVKQAKRGGVIINEHTLTATQVGRHVEVLGRWFDFIHLDELPGRLAKPAKRPFCLLTFDDGKRSNFTEVAPELELRRVPAVFYVTTGPLSDGCCLWFDRREQLVRALGHCSAELELETLKRLPFVDLVERLDCACARCGFRPPGEPDNNMQPMSWDEARNLSRRGFTIGAHGLTHAILTRETKERAFAEIEESLARVSAELGTRCQTFAFPNGNYNFELTRHALRCGATTVMTTEPMWADGYSSFCRLPRIQLFGEFDQIRIELKIAMAALGGLLPNPDGTGRAYRSISERNTILLRAAEATLRRRSRGPTRAEDNCCPS
jgi:peptidoglycan/xylan/chitin deacetylase (PgdA/CDA1 family)